MSHQFHFRSNSIKPSEVDRLAEAGGYESRSEYIRALIREDAQRKGVSL